MGEVAQALYGYGNGHQLLAGSIPLASKPARQLRAVTDMAFDGRAQSYLTALPLPELGRYALIRTWPAPESPRRGSVWSHALLIDLVAFSSIDDLRSLTSLFRRPGGSTADDLAPYERDLTLPEMRSGSFSGGRNGHLDAVLWAVYGESEPAVLHAEDPDQMEELLLAVWQQQWPRLRRTFAFRTRYRVSTQPNPFDVQIVERLERDQHPPAVPKEPPQWLARLRQSLQTPGDELSAFLRRFGTESPDGRRDMSTLVEIATLIEERSGGAVVKLIGSSFPQADQMASLKRYVLGAAEGEAQPWPVSELERLSLLLHAKPASAFDLDDLLLENRLDALWADHRAAARELLTAVDFSRSENSEVRAAILRAANLHAAPDDLAAVSEANPEAAIEVIKQRDDLLVAPSLWQGDPALVDFMLDLLSDTERKTREKTLRGLLEEGAVAASARLVEREPNLWWQALAWAASANKPTDDSAGLLDELLKGVGAGAIGAMPDYKQSSNLLETLATSVPPSLGLWRQVDPERWLELAPRWKRLGPRWAQLRMLVVLLAAAKTSKDDVRRGLWRTAFGPLHEALAREELNQPDLGTLVGLLPTPAGIEEWDHAGRLRAGVAVEIRRGSWPQDEIAEVVQAAEPYEAALLKALAAGKKKKKGWLRELADAILP